MLTSLIVLMGLATLPTNALSAKQPVPDTKLPAIPGVFQKLWNTEGSIDGGKVAIRLAELSKDAYLETDEARELFVKRGFKFTHAIRIESTVVYVVKVDDVCVVAFRGTNSIEDWFINLNFFKLPIDHHGMVHTGFHRAYQRVKDDIVKLVREGSPKHVWITGHSLGGAMALSCAYDFVEHQNIPISGVVTFGQPMISDDAYAAYLESKLKGKHARFVNGKDIVPSVPPTFCHCGSLFWFKDGKIQRNQSRQVYGATTMQERGTGGFGELRPLTIPEFEAEKATLRAKKAAAPQLYRGNVGGNSPYIADHSMSLYLDRVLEHLGSGDDADAEKPIQFDQSFVLPATGGETRMVVDRGNTIEMKINDPASNAMVSRLQIKDSTGVKFLGKRYKTDRSPDGGVMAGSGWTCLYFKVNQSERIEVEYSKNGKLYRHEITVRAHR